MSVNEESLLLFAEQGGNTGQYERPVDLKPSHTSDEPEITGLAGPPDASQTTAEGSPQVLCVPHLCAAVKQEDWWSTDSEYRGILVSSLVRNLFRKEKISTITVPDSILVNRSCTGHLQSESQRD